MLKQIRLEGMVAIRSQQATNKYNKEHSNYLILF